MTVEGEEVSSSRGGQTPPTSPGISSPICLHRLSDVRLFCPLVRPSFRLSRVYFFSLSLVLFAVENGADDGGGGDRLKG